MKSDVLALIILLIACIVISVSLRRLEYKAKQLDVQHNKERETKGTDHKTTVRDIIESIGYSVLIISVVFILGVILDFLGCFQH